MRCENIWRLPQQVLCPVVQVGVVQYGARVVNEFRLDDFRTVEEVVAAARNIDQRGGEETRTALAISEARYSGVFVCYSLTFTNCASLFTREYLEALSLRIASP